MDARSFAAGVSYRISAETMTEFYVRVLSGSPIPETESPRGGYSASAALQRLGGRVIGPATAKYEVFAITVNGNTIGVVAVDLERGVPVRKRDCWNRSIHRLLRHNIVTGRGRRRERQT
jgi:hypothetical protein